MLAHWQMVTGIREGCRPITSGLEKLSQNRYLWAADLER